MKMASTPAMRIALFLGAGASVCAGMPTTQEFLKAYWSHIIDAQLNAGGGDCDTRRFIRDIIAEHKNDDIEKLYDGVVRAIGFYESQNCRPIAERLVKDNMDCAAIADALKRLRSDIQKCLRRAYLRGGYSRGELLNFPLSNAYVDEGAWNAIWDVIKGAGADKFVVFTTNYDCVMELYAEDSAGLILVNGFTQHRRADNVWTGEWNDPGEPALYLTKLHGSVSWYRDRENRVVEPDIPEQSAAYHGTMIFPTEGPKDYAGVPFTKLMERFRDEMKKVETLLVIGFSYRDEEIVDVITKEVDRGMVLISMSPDAVTDIRSVTEDTPKPVEISGQTLLAIGRKVVLVERELMSETISETCDALAAAFEFTGSDKSIDESRP